MCVPAGAIAPALATISAIGTAAQIAAQNVQSQMDELAALRAYNMDILALQERARQTQAAYDLEAFERSRQALRERARIAVAAGEAGVGGRSLIRELANSMFQEAYDIGVYRQNLQNRLAQTSLQAQGIGAQAVSRIEAARASRINPFLGALMIGGSAASAYYTAPRTGG